MSFGYVFISGLIVWGFMFVLPPMMLVASGTPFENVATEVIMGVVSGLAVTAWIARKIANDG